MNFGSIVKRPIINEKSLKYASSENKYLFEVGRLATKGQIRKSVEELFGVTVLSVNTMKNALKKKKSSVKRGVSFEKSGIKKALVQLKKGQKIELFDVSEKKKK